MKRCLYFISAKKVIVRHKLKQRFICFESIKLKKSIFIQIMNITHLFNWASRSTSSVLPNHMLQRLVCEIMNFINLPCSRKKIHSWLHELIYRLIFFFYFLGAYFYSINLDLRCTSERSVCCNNHFCKTGVDNFLMTLTSHQ